MKKIAITLVLSLLLQSLAPMQVMAAENGETLCEPYVSNEVDEAVPQDETVQNETVQDETVQNETIQDETVQNETVQDETGHNETVQDETVQNETIQDETVQNETVQDETVQNETVQDETVQNETVQDETVQNETIQDETVQNETIQDETVQDETIQDETVQDETSAGNTDTIEADDTLETDVVEYDESKKAWVYISGLSINDRTYNGEKISYSGTPFVKTYTGIDVTDEVELTFTYRGKQDDGTEYESSPQAPVNAGFYYLTVAVSDDDESYKGSWEHSFSIMQVPIDIAVSDAVFFIGGDAEALPEEKYTVEGLLNGDKLITQPSFEYRASDNNSIVKEDIDLTKIGTYQIVCLKEGLDAGANYKIDNVYNGTLEIMYNPAIPDNENIILASGDYQNTEWKITALGKLIVSGEGEFADKESEKGRAVPWIEWRSRITSAEINVTGMKNASYMFADCANLKEVVFQNSDTGSVQDTHNMFYMCSKLQDPGLQGLNTENVTDMHEMFYGCIGLVELDISGLKTGNVINMSGMFRGCSGLRSLDLQGFDTASVTDMSWMFAECSGLMALDISGLKTGNVENMYSMFQNCSCLETLTIGDIDTSNVTDMGWMFESCSSLESFDLAGLDTDNVVMMRGMFYENIKLKSLDLSHFNTQKVKDMGSMFSRCENLTELNLKGFSTGAVSYMHGMFSECSSLKELDLGSFDTGSAVHMGMMFEACTSLTELNLKGFDTSNVTDFSYMFSRCTDLQRIIIDRDKFSTSKAKTMRAMFNACESLSEMDFSKFDTSNVTNMSRMFFLCDCLTELDLSSFDTSNVTDMEEMILGCNLKTVDISSFDMGSVSNASDFLGSCECLELIKTPIKCGMDIALPKYDYTYDTEDIKWTDADGMEYEYLPKDTTESVTLYKNGRRTGTDPYITAVKQKKHYHYGETLNLDDLTVKYYDGKGGSEIVTGYTTNADQINMSPYMSAIVNLIVQYDGLTDHVLLNIDVVREKVPAPIASVPSGSVAAGTEIALVTDKEDASIYYFIDGGSIRLYTGPIRLNRSCKITAYAKKEGVLDSDEVNYVYTVMDGMLLSPSADIPSGSVTKGTKVSLSAPDEGTEIYYTTDGSVPTKKGGMKYEGPIEINSDTTIRAIAVKDGFPTSSDASFRYKVKVQETEEPVEEEKTYTICYDGNGSDGGTMDSQKCVIGQEQMLLANSFTKKGHVFNGWNTSKTGDGKSYTDKEKVTDLSTKDGDTVTLYAQWKADEGKTDDDKQDDDKQDDDKKDDDKKDDDKKDDDKKDDDKQDTSPKEYSITYIVDGVESPDGNPSKYKDNESVTLIIPTKKGYTFNGWYSDSNLTVKVTEIEKGGKSNVTLYAKWVPNTYTVKFDGNGGAGSMESLAVDYDTEVALTENTFTKAWSTFSGWNTDADGNGTSYSDKEAVKNLSDESGATVTLYAQWLERKGKYTITYYPKGGKKNPENPNSYDKDWETITLLPATKEGYTFKGWYKTSSYTGKVTKIKKGSNRNWKLYAKWAPNKYSVTFNKNGGKGKMSKMTGRTYGKTFKLSANKFKRTGYKFKGWNTEKDGTGTQYTNKASVKNLTAESNGNIILYAQWEKK